MRLHAPEAILEHGKAKISWGGGGGGHAPRPPSDMKSNSRQLAPPPPPPPPHFKKVIYTPGSIYLTFKFCVSKCVAYASQCYVISLQIYYIFMLN